MCRRSYIYLFLGILISLFALGLGGYFGVQHLMVVETKSPLGFEATVNAITEAAESQNWKIPKVYRLCKSLEKENININPVAVIELCKPAYAAELLSHDDTRLVSSFMPCRISVYEKKDGSVIVSRMNTSLVSRIFRGKISEVMMLATRETKSILGQALAPEPKADS